MAKRKHQDIPAEIVGDKSVTQYFHEDYKDYAVYTILDRAIPSFVDGMKPVQRKALATTYKKASKKLMQVDALAGAMRSEMKYKHGPASAEGAIIKMAQKFMAPMPYLEEKGQYGYIYDQAAGAPRYLDTRLTKYATMLMNQDQDLLNHHYEGGEKLEPITYLPILPMMVINGTDGIAVGFATSYTNRNPLEIALSTKHALKHGKLPKNLKITPYVHGHLGSWSFFRGKWEHVGRFERLNKTVVRVTGLPVGWQLSGYNAFLHDMRNRGQILDFQDFSNSKGIHIDIHIHEEVLDTMIETNTILRDLSLVYRFPNDNLTCIMPDNTWRKFDNVNAFIEEFVRFRLGVYTARKNKMLTDIQRNIDWNNDIIKFIDLINTGVVDFRTQTEQIIKDILTKHKINPKVLDIKVSSLTIDNRGKFVDKMAQLQRDLDATKKIKEKQMYLNDLDVLIKEIEKDYIIEDYVNILEENITRINDHA